MQKLDAAPRRRQKARHAPEHTAVVVGEKILKDRVRIVEGIERFLKARCVLEKRCTPVELTQLQRFNPSGENRREMGKSVPGRFPSNQDSIGIELVGDALPHGNKVPEQKKIYQPVTTKQNASLRWLASELASTLKVPMTEIFRHPDISRKNPTEAGTAKW